MRNPDFDCDLCGEYNEPTPREFDSVTLWLCDECWAAVQSKRRLRAQLPVALVVLALATPGLLITIWPEPKPLTKLSGGVAGTLCLEANDMADRLVVTRFVHRGVGWVRDSGFFSGNVTSNVAGSCDSERRARERAPANIELEPYGK